MKKKNHQILNEMIPVIKSAGKILLNYFKKDNLKSFKFDGSFFLNADIESEKYLIDNLKLILPEAGIYSEEFGQENENNQLCWVIDPLDGTVNFSQGIEYFSISVALTFNKNPIIAIIYDPIKDELFSSILNNGSFLNDQKILISSKKTLKNSFCSVLFGNRADKITFEKIIDNVVKVATVRSFGSAALDQAYLASGRFDAIFCGRLSWWDLAAGSLLIKESGGCVSDFKENQILGNSTSFMAGSNEICKDFLKKHL